MSNREVGAGGGAENLTVDAILGGKLTWRVFQNENINVINKIINKVINVICIFWVSVEIY